MTSPALPLVASTTTLSPASAIPVVSTRRSSEPVYASKTLPGNCRSPISPGNARRYSWRAYTRSSLRCCWSERSAPRSSRNMMSTESGTPGEVRRTIPPALPLAVCCRATGSGTFSRSRTLIALAWSAEITARLSARAPREWSRAVVTIAPFFRVVA